MIILTPERVANSIRMQRSQYSGTFLLVEGEKDKSLYERFIDKKVCRIQVLFQKDNKNNIIKVIEILSSDKEQFSGAVAILDADYLLLENEPIKNSKIFLTDFHDLEMMLINSPGFDKLINEFVSEQKLKEFGKYNIRDELLEMGKYIGHLRWISYKNNYRLNFNELEFKKIIDIKHFTVFGLEELIKVVKDNTISKSYGEEKQYKYKIDEKSIKDETERLMCTNSDLKQVCCGHDLICILSIGLRRVLGTYDLKQVEPEVIERELRLAYEAKYFEDTELYKSIITWECVNIPFKILLH